MKSKSTYCCMTKDAENQYLKQVKLNLFLMTHIRFFLSRHSCIYIEKNKSISTFKYIYIYIPKSDLLYNLSVHRSFTIKFIINIFPVQYMCFCCGIAIFCLVHVHLNSNHNTLGYYSNIQH